MTRRLCAHADRNGDGMHWLAAGEVCSDSTETVRIPPTNNETPAPAPPPE